MVWFSKSQIGSSMIIELNWFSLPAGNQPNAKTCCLDVEEPEKDAVLGRNFMKFGNGERYRGL
jgi:hypothetical protein